MKKLILAIFTSLLVLSLLSLVYADSANSGSGSTGSGTSGSSGSGASTTTHVDSSGNTGGTVNNPSTNMSKNKRIVAAEAELRVIQEAKLRREQAQRNKEGNNETHEMRKDGMEDRLAKIIEFKRRLEMHQEIELKERAKIHALTDEQKEIIAGKINAKTGLNLTAEDLDNKTILKAYLSNGRFAEVKIMPNRASAVALARLRAKCVERNCTLELREVGNADKNESRMAYEVKTDKDSRLFFIFPKKMHVEAKVDAETGQIIDSKKPWWAFMAKEDNASDQEIEAETSVNASASTNVSG